MKIIKKESFKNTNHYDVYAALIGYFIWGDVPDEWKICGAALIVGAGIFILYREGQQKAVR